MTTHILYILLPSLATHFPSFEPNSLSIYLFLSRCGRKEKKRNRILKVENRCMIDAQTMMQQAEPSLSSPSPSLSSYSSETLAEIAARVIEELRRDPHSVPDDEAIFQPWENGDNFTAQPDQNDDDDDVGNDNPVENDDDDDDFEFTFVSRDPKTSPVSADDIFYNGQIRPMYPIFDRNLLFNAPTPLNDGVSSVSPIPNTNHDAAAATRRRRLPLRKLMFEERETGSCSSSTSEADDSVDLERVAEGSYCAWTPNSVGIRERKKSSSTGSVSKRWKLRDLIIRSHSEGKEKMVFQVPSKRTNKVANETAKPSSGYSIDGASVENRTVGTAKNHGDQTKRKSLLPYRQELVGLFANVNGLGRTLHPF